MISKLKFVFSYLGKQWHVLARVILNFPSVDAVFEEITQNSGNMSYFKYLFNKTTAAENESP